MKLNKLLIVIGVVLALTALALGAASALPIFTGSAPDDFAEADFVINDPVPEVGNPLGTTSGWEVDDIYFDYDSSDDVMYIGIDCVGICGDADGDGDPGGTSQALADLGGLDRADLGGEESFALAIDTDNDFLELPDDPYYSGDFEVVVGVSIMGDINTFGTYNYTGSPFAPQSSFGTQLPNATILYANPSGPDLYIPDIEFSIADFSTLPGFTLGEALEFQVRLYAGSREDSGIGEDYVFGTVNIDVDGDGQPGTGTPGYWKNHPEAWPVDEITIGGVTYSKDEAIPLMKEDKHDKTTTMFRSLVAAKLNVLIGNESSCIAETIIAADGWMATYGPVGSGVRANSAAWKEGEPLYLTLDDYNNGLLCAPSRDDLE
jgi:hypothetical protein